MFKKKKQKTNYLVLKTIFNHFKSEMERRSLPNYVVFPTNFTVLMHAEDYKDVLPDIVIILKVLVADLYKEIKRNSAGSKEFCPVAQEWIFKFSPSNHLPGTTDEIQEGKPAVVSENPIRTNSDNITEVEDIRATIWARNSWNMRTVSLQKARFAHIEIKSEGCFQIPFNPALTLEDSQVENMKPKVLTELQYRKDNILYTYYMTDSEIDIVSNMDRITGSHVLDLRLPGLNGQIAKIKYHSVENVFKIAAYKEVRMNGVTLQESSEDKPEWSDLYDKSKFLITSNPPFPIGIKIMH